MIPHPLRAGSYSAKLYPHKSSLSRTGNLNQKCRFDGYECTNGRGTLENSYDQCPSRDFSTIELLRNISNISSQLRHEVANVSWARTRVNVGCDKIMDGTTFFHLSLLGKFLHERYAVVPRIKYLNISIDFGNNDVLEKFNTGEKY